jgi:hypothetical protein
MLQLTLLKSVKCAQIIVKLVKFLIKITVLLVEKIVTFWMGFNVN